MSIITRYFSTTSAGLGDGTTWNDRAALFTTGNWSTVITGFNFSGTDALLCYFGTGSYTCSQSLATGLFTNPPTAANPLFFHGCNSSGVALTPPSPNWTSDQPAWDDSSLPVIATTTNIGHSSLPQVRWRLIKLTASARNSSLVTNDTNGSFDWCVAINSTSNTAAIGIGTAATRVIRNCVISMTGTAYQNVIQTSSGETVNSRIVGSIGSSGNRNGIEYSATSGRVYFTKCFVASNGGSGIFSSSANVAENFVVDGCTIVNNSAAGITLASTALQTVPSYVANCCVTGNGTYGIDTQSQAKVILLNNRFRDNASGNINGLINYPDFDSYTTDSDDTTEYNNPAGGDYRIKPTVAFANKGIGVSQVAGATRSNTGFMGARNIGVY